MQNLCKKLILVKTLTIQVNLFTKACYQASENLERATTVRPFKRTATLEVPDSEVKPTQKLIVLGMPEDRIGDIDDLLLIFVLCSK